MDISKLNIIFESLCVKSDMINLGYYLFSSISFNFYFTDRCGKKIELNKIIHDNNKNFRSSYRGNKYY